jgi:hypothetical protein
VAAKARPELGLHVGTPAFQMCMTGDEYCITPQKYDRLGHFLVDFVPVQSKFVADSITEWQGYPAIFGSTKSRA